MIAQAMVAGQNALIPSLYISRRAASANVPSMALAGAVRPQASSARAEDGKVSAPVSLEERLFDNSADLKIMFSQIAMYLPIVWRTQVFAQLDELLDFESWQDDSSLISSASYFTFLRFTILSKTVAVPHLGVSSRGSLLAAWRRSGEQISVEFFPDDQAVASIVKVGSRGKESAAWRGHVAKLIEFSSAFGATRWMTISEEKIEEQS